MKNIPILLSALSLVGCATTDPSATEANQPGAKETISLFDQSSIDDWEMINGGQWAVGKGIFHGYKAAEIDKHCLLVSEREFADFELTLDYKAIKGNSGFYFRLAPEDNGLGFKGYHAEIDASGSNAGGIYDVAVDWISKPDEALVAHAFKPGAWNTMKVRAVGQDITVWLNGHQMSKIHFDRSDKGKLGFQLHAGEDTTIQLRNLEVEEL